MSLDSGSRFGPYEIIGSLGQGGMGLVYRGRDTRLNRQVAIKVLPPAFASDPDRLARFEREAQVLASLNHPHIAQVYGFEQSTAGQAIVMELVEGEDLAERLSRGAVPLDEALEIAVKIADALEAAHALDIVHRDLKPGNVRITPDGSVKVLDFGLAKALGNDAPGESNQTITSPVQMTQAGMILGTAAYMAPEQAKGRAVDKRADIWAFGCVLYEMLTGERLFKGDSVAETIGLIVTRDVDLSSLPATTPPRVRDVLDRCLQRDPRARLRDIGDARLEIERARVEPTLHAAAGGSPWPRRAVVLLAVLASGLLIGWLAGQIGSRDSTVAPPRVYTLRQLTELPGPEREPSLSPDGRQFIYASGASGNQDIYLLRVGGDRAINLTNSPAHDSQPAFSFDGQTIAFRSERDGGGIFVMGATGESVRRVTRAGYNPAWSPDGRFLVYATETVEDPYARLGISELWTVEVATGATKKLHGGDAVQPTWSPDGSRIAYWANDQGQRDVWTMAADGTQPVAITADTATDWSPSWSSDSNALYFSSDRGGSMNVWRVDLHPQTHAPREAPTPVTSSVRALGYTRAVAQDNRIVVMAYDRVADLELYRVTPTGVERTATLRPRSAHWCAPSPDATWIACSTSGAAEDVILLKADGSELRRLTNDAIKDRVPIWAPDGQSLAFPSTRSGEWGLWSVGIDGSELRQLSAMRDGQDQVFSADGKELLVASFTDVWRVPTAPGGRLDSAQKVATPVPGLHPLAWDRDGKRVAAYEATPAGTITGIGIWDLTANQFTRFPANVANIDPNGVVGGWLPDGRHVVFRTADGVMLIDATAPRNQRVILSCGPRDRVTVSRDGRTLLVEREVFDSDIWMLERQP